MRRSGSKNKQPIDSVRVLPLHRSMRRDPDLAPRKSAARAARQERLAEALRENLRRRKEQARAKDRLAHAQSEENGQEHEPPA
jgi:hypothetical protein